MQPCLGYVSCAWGESMKGSEHIPVSNQQQKRLIIIIIMIMIPKTSNLFLLHPFHHFNPQRFLRWFSTSGSSEGQVQGMVGAKSDRISTEQATRCFRTSPKQRPVFLQQKQPNRKPRKETTKNPRPPRPSWAQVISPPNKKWMSGKDVPWGEQ